MNKSYAIYLFKGTQALADALKVSRQTIYNWPELLEQRNVDQIVGAAKRLNIHIPEDR